MTMSYIIQQYCGSGDPEKADAIHAVDYLNETFPDIQGFCEVIWQVEGRINQLDPHWHPPQTTTVIPVPPLQQGTHHGRGGST